jgi:uncharacterized circularly permuted ATP-grasp superfamily protein
VGSHATEAKTEECRARVLADPRNYVAQPILALSTAPTLCKGRIEPRHLDLRPFVLSGDEQYVTAGGLTRVALRAGSLVVNSSQGGGSKDTWILDPDPTVSERPDLGADPGADADPATQTQTQTQSLTPGAP